MNLSDWDTTAILSSVSVALFMLLIAAWREIRGVQHKHESLLAKIAELEKSRAERQAEHDRQLAEAGRQKNEQIQRQQQEIVELHARLASASGTFIVQAPDFRRRWRS